MTYEQSLRNIEKLKDLVIPLGTHHVFFDFSNNFEFILILFEYLKSKNIVSELMTTKFRSKLPLGGIIFNKLDHEIFYYEDKNIRYEYDMTTQEILMHDSKEPFRNYSPAQLVIEINKLLLKLKNM